MSTDETEPVGLITVEVVYNGTTYTKMVQFDHEVAPVIREGYLRLAAEEVIMQMRADQWTT